jgi:uncharacterized membrane protein (UPF0136 family)
VKPKLVAWCVVLFALLVAAGGVVGWRKEGSEASLWSGVACAALLAVGAGLLGAGRPAGRVGVIAVCAAIALFFAYRLATKGAPMPALPVIVLSLSTALLVWRSKPAAE